MVMGNCKNSRVLNFVILLKSRKFDAREIYMFYSKDSAICSVSSAEASLFFGQLQNNTMSNDTDLSPAVSSSYSRSPVSCRAVSYDETTSKQTHCQTPINTTTIWYSSNDDDDDDGKNKTRLLSNLRPTTRECLHLVTCVHSRSRDKYGGHAILSARVENPRYMQTSWLYDFQNRSYGRSKFCIAGIGIFNTVFVPVALTR